MTQTLSAKHYDESRKRRLVDELRYALARTSTGSKDPERRG
jgi:hypothetical protein